MSTFDCRNNSFCSGKIFKSIYCFVICNRHVLCSSDIIKVCMLRTYTRIIKTCGDGVYRCDLSVLILAEVGFHTMEDSETTGCDGCRSFRSIYATSCCLTADETNVFVLNEIVEGSDSIGAAAHTGQDNIRKPALFSSICSLISLEITA